MPPSPIPPEITRNSDPRHPQTREQKIEEQSEFVEWWAENVSVNRGAGRGNKINADRGTFSLSAAEQHSGIKLRATIRIGEISLGLETAEGFKGNQHVVRPTDGTKHKREVLQAAGISKSAAHRAEQERLRAKANRKRSEKQAGNQNAAKGGPENSRPTSSGNTVSAPKDKNAGAVAAAEAKERAPTSSGQTLPDDKRSMDRICLAESRKKIPGRNRGKGGKAPDGARGDQRIGVGAGGKPGSRCGLTR